MDDSKSLKDELSGANLGHNHRLSIKQQHRQNIGLLFNSASSFDDNAIEVNKSDF
jgi:hypothetical protein